MVTQQLTLKVRDWSSLRNWSEVEHALNDAGIAYEDLYTTPCPGVWQMETFTNPATLENKLDIVKTSQDENDAGIFWYVQFRYTEPLDPDKAAFYDRADRLFEERGNR